MRTTKQVLVVPPSLKSSPRARRRLPPPTWATINPNLPSLFTTQNPKHRMRTAAHTLLSSPSLPSSTVGLMRTAAHNLLSSPSLPSSTVGFTLVAATFAAASAFAYTRGGGNEILSAWWFDGAVSTLGFALSISIYDKLERCDGVSPRGGPSVIAAVYYWVFVLAFTTVVPPPSPPTPNLPPTLFVLVLEVVTGIVLYDALFFILHFGMHKCRALHALSSHATHHRLDGSLRARDVLNHGAVDGLLQVMTNILVQRRTPWGSTKSRLARAVHNIVVTWCLTESHTSTERLKVARRFMRGVRLHRCHHLKNSSHYQQFFSYLDDALLLLSVPLSAPLSAGEKNE